MLVLRARGDVSKARTRTAIVPWSGSVLRERLAWWLRLGWVPRSWSGSSVGSCFVSKARSRTWLVAWSMLRGTLRDL